MIGRLLLVAWLSIFVLCGLHASETPQATLEHLRGDFEKGLSAGYKSVKPAEEVTLTKGGTGWLMHFVNERWELKSLPQQGSTHPPDNMPEEEKLKIADHILDYIEVWLIPRSSLNAGKLNPKDCVTRLGTSSEWYRELAYLGDKDGFACLVDAPIYQWVSLQKRLQISGGDDPIAAAIRGFAIADKGSMTGNSSEEIIRNFGIRTFPYIKKAVAENKSGLSWAIVTAAEWNDPKVDVWLENNVGNPNPEIANAVRYGFILHPKKQWENYYVKWLNDPPGKFRAIEPLTALSAIKSSRIPECADKVMNAPYDFSDYYTALKIKRESLGLQIPEKLLQAEGDIEKHGCTYEPSYDLEAVKLATQVILDSKAYDAEFLLGLELAGYHIKGNCAPVAEAGASILAHLPDNKGDKTVQFLAEKLKDDSDIKRLQENLARIHHP